MKKDRWREKKLCCSLWERYQLTDGDTFISFNMAPIFTFICKWKPQILAFNPNKVSVIRIEEIPGRLIYFKQPLLTFDIEGGGGNMRITTFISRPTERISFITRESMGYKRGIPKNERHKRHH